MDRMGLASSAASERAEVYGRTIDAIHQAPLTGLGYGTFANAFGMHRGDQLRSPFKRAHNTYLENALLLAVGWIVLICASSVLRHRRRAVLPCLGVAATALVGVHATVDYSLQIPAVAMAYAAILGAACAQSIRLELSDRPATARRAA